MPQVAQKLDDATSFVPRELIEVNKENISNWAEKIRKAHITGEKASTDNYMDVSCVEREMEKERKMNKERKGDRERESDTLWSYFHGCHFMKI